MFFSVILAMRFAVPVVRTWACQLSNQAKKLSSLEICCKMIFNKCCLSLKKNICKQIGFFFNNSTMHIAVF